MDDFELVRLCQLGEKEAFSSLIDKYYKNIYRFAFQNLQNHHDADEICQETFLRAIENIKTIRDGNSLKCWIFTITQNLIRKHYKESKRKMTYDAENPDMDDIKFKVEQIEPSDNLLAKEKKYIIRQQLLNMPNDLQDVVVLVLIEDFSQKQTSSILDCSEASVSRRLDTAKNWLKIKLKDLV